MTQVPTVILSRTAAAFAGMGRRVQVPTKLGPVTLLRPLGEGGMSVVHLGRHEILQKNVAVKFLLDIPGSPDDPRFAAFLEGARAAATIKHPGLNEVYNSDAVENVPYLIMELIEGPTLAEVIKRHGPMPMHIARAVVERTCAAVGELHDHGMIHRDIKPANVMIDPTGRVVVTDFGLAMPRPAALFGGPAGGIAGTPAYMAPEMFEASVSTRTDVYAMGITIFELLLGKAPFDGDFQTLRLAHRTAALPVGMLAGAGVPEGVIVLIERTMHKDALFRPKSARHILDAFSKACDAAGISAATDSQIQRFVEVGSGSGSEKTATATSAPAYYARLNTLAEFKRRTPEGSLLSDKLPQEETAPADAAPAAADSSAPVADKGAKPGITGRHLDVRPWIACLVLSLIGGVILSLSVHLGQWLWQRGVLIAEGMGFIRHAADSELQAAGRTIYGRLPLWYELPMDAFIAATCFVLPLLLVWRAYQRAVLRRPPCNGSTLCGWCGFRLSGLKDPRCPDCGKVIGMAARGARPPSSWWINRARRYGVAAGAFLVAALLLVPFFMWLYRPGKFELTFAWLGWLGLVMTLCLFASLVAFHFVGRSSAFLTGRAYCGHCAAELQGLTKPECNACGHCI